MTLSRRAQVTLGADGAVLLGVLAAIIVVASLAAAIGVPRGDLAPTLIHRGAGTDR